MDWENDPWRKKYVLPDATQIVLGWEGCLLLDKLWMAADSAGIIDLPAIDDDERVAILADALRIPLDVVSTGLPKLTQRFAAKGVPWLEVYAEHLFLPWYLESQKSRQTDKARKQRSREMRAAEARLGDLSEVPGKFRSPQNTSPPKLLPAADVTSGDQDVTPGDSEVTPGDKMSPPVTNGHEEKREEENRGEKKRKSCSFDFEKAYRPYPRKQGKKDGFKKLKDQVETQADYDQLVSAIRKMGELWEGADEEQASFCPYFSSFVNQELWRDEELPAPKKQGVRAQNQGYAPAPAQGEFQSGDHEDVGGMS